MSRARLASRSLLLTALLAVGGAGVAQAQPASRRVDVSFEDATLIELVRYVARVTGHRFILTGATREVRVSIVSQRPVTPAELYDGFLSVLEMHGLAVVRVGAYHRIVETEGIEGQPTPIVTDEAAGPRGDAFRLHLLRLRGGSVEEAAALLANFSSPGGTIATDLRTGTLLITDTDANVRRMRAILENLHRPEPETELHVERLRHADATALAASLSRTTSE